MIVNDVKIKLAQENNSSTNEKVKKILADFQKIKIIMLDRGVI